MGRTIDHSRSSSDPVPALVLLLVGITSLCLAVLYPLQQLAAQVSIVEMASGAAIVLSADTIVVVAGLLVISVSATTLGVLVLFLRL